MSLQARFSQADPRLYAVERDVAHAFKPMVLEVADRLEKERWDIAAEVLRHYNVTSEQVGMTAQAFCQFVMSSTERRESMEECLTRSGWFDQPEAAQLAYMAILGTVVSGYFFEGTRKAWCMDKDPAPLDETLRNAGARCARAMTYPRWRRRVAMLWLRIKAAIQTLRGKS